MTHFERDGVDISHLMGRSEAYSLFYNKSEAEVRYVNQAGDRMTGVLDMNNNKITNLVTEDNADAANKQYVDSMVDNALATTLRTPMEVVLDMNGNKITNIPTPTDSTDAANKGYVDQSLATYFTTDASTITMLKPIDMGN